MITGSHTILFTTDAEADRGFFHDVLGLPSSDVGAGWLVFELPPSELACHPSEAARHELYLTCDDIDVVVAKLAQHAVPCSSIREERWGRLVRVTLPSGGSLGIYQPREPRG